MAAPLTFLSKETADETFATVAPDPDNSVSYGSFDAGTVIPFAAVTTYDNTVPLPTEDVKLIIGVEAVYGFRASDGVIGNWRRNPFDTYTPSGANLIRSAAGVITPQANWASRTITSIEGDIASLSGWIQAPTEQLTGEMWNKKPVYCRAFKGQIGNTSPTNVLLGSIAGITRIRRVEGLVTGDGRQRSWPVGTGHNRGGNNAGVWKDAITSLMLDVECSEGFTLDDYYDIVVYYIK
ncbi:hypothetical protein FACS189479_04380 [Spirochaetia bacterium]|nr:hypothetical protein FACS189479_04380 [Spirochaetia bacterium]